MKEKTGFSVWIWSVLVKTTRFLKLSSLIFIVMYTSRATKL